MRYKTQLFIILLIALGLTACQRGQDRKTDDARGGAHDQHTGDGGRAG